MTEAEHKHEDMEINKKFSLNDPGLIKQAVAKQVINAAKNEDLNKKCIVKELLRIENILREINSNDFIRNDFLNGHLQAFKISESDLMELKVLHEKLAPNPFDSCYIENLKNVQTHVHKLLASDESVFQSLTYKDMKFILDKLVECNYWKNRGINLSGFLYFKHLK